MNPHGVKAWVSGRVQGVGFRYFAARHAQAENLCGYACNLRDGRVEILLQGEADAIARVIEQLRVGPSHARVIEVRLEDVPDTPLVQGFVTR